MLLHILEFLSFQIPQRMVPIRASSSFPLDPMFESIHSGKDAAFAVLNDTLARFQHSLAYGHSKNKCIVASLG